MSSTLLPWLPFCAWDRELDSAYRMLTDWPTHAFSPHVSSIMKVQTWLNDVALARLVSKAENVLYSQFIPNAELEACYILETVYMVIGLNWGCCLILETLGESDSLPRPTPLCLIHKQTSIKPIFRLLLLRNLKFFFSVKRAAGRSLHSLCWCSNLFQLRKPVLPYSESKSPFLFAQRGIKTMGHYN